MGKAAQNEQHKLLAAFYNNLAVAAGASGVLAPLFGLIAKYGDWSRTHKARDAIEAFNQISADDIFGAIVFLLIFGVTAWVGLLGCKHSS